MTLAFAKVGVKDSVASAVRKTLIQGFISPFAVGTHPTDIANAGRILTRAAAVAGGILAVTFGREKKSVEKLKLHWV